MLSGGFSGIAGLWLLYHWNGGNVFLSVLKKERSLSKKFTSFNIKFEWLIYWMGTATSEVPQRGVCVCERDRHWGKAVSSVLHSVHSNVRKIIIANLLSLVYQARERERILQACRIRRLVAALPTGNDKELKDFMSWKPDFFLRKRVF